MDWRQSGDSPCIPWQGAVNDQGYGTFNRRLAHRLAWEANHGPLPSSVVLRHDCDNRLCVNVAHLRPGTHADNVADRVARGRSAIGERNGRHKLTLEQARQIRQRSEAGETPTALAREYGINRRNVDHIVSGRLWPEPGAVPAQLAGCHPDRPAYTRDGRCRVCYLRDWRARKREPAA